MSISTWKRCSSCKDDIEFGETYWVCNVSTCNRKRTGMYFCSVSCWEAHLPMMRHREAYAVEKRAPSASEWERQQAEEKAAEERPIEGAAERPIVRAASRDEAPRRRVVTQPEPEDDLPRDILIVVSKLKKYIKARSGMNTSDNVMPRLSDHVRWIANQAIKNAAQDERKTVLDRDIPPVPR